MLLNKLNVSSNGFVALLETSGNGRLLQSLQDEFFKTKTNMKLLELSSATLVVKCPLFVQMNLSQHGLRIIPIPSKELEAYVPDLSEIKANSVEDKEAIHEYLKITTEALLLNQQGLPMDGADNFTAQILTPISVYSEIIVSGNIRQWVSFTSQGSLPSQVENYRSEINNILVNEWKNLETLKNLLR